MHIIILIQYFNLILRVLLNIILRVSLVCGISNIGIHRIYCNERAHTCRSVRLRLIYKPKVSRVKRTYLHICRSNCLHTPSFNLKNSQSVNRRAKESGTLAMQRYKF